MIESVRIGLKRIEVIVAADLYSEDGLDLEVEDDPH